ncbi:DUF1885 family protein [Shimazuella kribbensis]|uniref:DUF1885 family protein n=1 Tax=Shimazuella kribbensis TaxID=139808 RepID=UPI000419AF12|nr:DUF1885 family protein [Shimazuella kribbensis]
MSETTSIFKKTSAEGWFVPLKKSAYIRRKDMIELANVKDTLEYYREMTRNTGKQLAWDYEAAAFPYTMEEKEENGIPYILLTGRDPHQNNHMVIGVGRQKENEKFYVQIVLPEDATHHDVAKGNEYAKFIAKHLKGELELFNGRIMAF